jgi:Phospholipase_D-nuclease N-terminal
MPGVARPDREKGASMGIKTGGLLGLIVLIADVWAIVHVMGSRHSVGAKVAWTVLILIFPIVGFLIWLLFGPRAIR